MTPLLRHFNLRVAVLVSASIFAVTANAEAIEGRVVSVADGDTITVLTDRRQQHRIRLDGIDAPERGQPYSQISRRYLADLVSGRIVTVESSKTDRFGRMVGVVRNDQYRDVGLEQIKAGLAWHFKRYEHEQTPENRAAYATAEAIAKAARRGLWRDPEPVPPWEFRATSREVPASVR